MQKKVFYLLQWWLVLLFTVIVSANAFGASPSERIGKIVTKTTPVHVIRKGKKLTVGTLGMVIRQGDEAVTGSTGKARILLEGGNMIYLGPSSNLKLTKQTSQSGFAKVRRYILSLLGKLRARIRKTENVSVQVHTPTAVIGVKGTDFVVQFENRITRVGTITGTVMLTSSITTESIDISKGRMGFVSPAGEILPLREFAGELMKDMDFAGEKMDDSDFSGDKVEM